MNGEFQFSQFPDRLVVIAGTYDGVLAGFDSQVDEEKGADLIDQGDRDNTKSLVDMLNAASGATDDDSFLKMNFAMAVHDGSVRSVSVATGKDLQQKKLQDNESKNDSFPDALISCGFDETINIFSLHKKSQIGEVKTPSDLGTPTCSSFAPPNDPSPTHVLVGLSSGKIVIYRKKDWSVQHILACHDDKGVNAIAVHPSGKMALTGGKDRKICLWDLIRGRLAFVYKIGSGSKGKKVTVNDIIWSDDGKRYAFCTHEGNITAREVETGNDLLDINLPNTSKPNQICFVGGEDGLFLAAACNDGGLPLFAVGSIDEDDEDIGTRRALMAIEPVEGVATAGDERFKCIRSVKGGSGFLVVTANSGGIISLIDLEGAARMMLEDSDGDGSNDDQEQSVDSDASSDSDDDDEDVAAEILNSVRIGSGARITSLSVWSHSSITEDDDLVTTDREVSDDDRNEIDVEEKDEEDDDEEDSDDEPKPLPNKKRKITTISLGNKGNEIEMDEEALKQARALVSQAKKREKRKNKKGKSKQD